MPQIVAAHNFYTNLGGVEPYMKTFKGGVHVPDNKHLTEALAIEQMPIVPEYYVALSQHIGAPAQPVVKAGDKVNEGQLIAEAAKGLSANIHSPVCGEVVGIVSRKNAQGVLKEYIHLKTSAEQKSVSMKPLSEQCTAQEIVSRIAEAGIVGLGGAGFPTAVKLQPSEPVDTLIINGAECEPYLNSDNRLMIERSEEVVRGIRLIAKALGVQRIVVGIEANKPEAIARMSGHEGVEVVTLKKKYPQGAEKMLIWATVKRKVPCGQLPMNAGVVVDNIATAYAVYNAVVNGVALYKKVMTVSGRGIATPKNIEVRVGTPLSAIVEYCGGLSQDTVKMIMGGPMMGVAIDNLDIALTKPDGGFLALTNKEADTLLPVNCIKCGRCVDHCPMSLMPLYIDFYTSVGDYQNAVKYGALNCMECGVCAYVCPSRRPIVQSVRLAKFKIKEKK